MFGGRLRKNMCFDDTDRANRNAGRTFASRGVQFGRAWTASLRSFQARAPAAANWLSCEVSNRRMEIIMKKFVVTAAVLLMSSTGAYAAAPGAVGKAVASCCSAFAACCEAAMACCG